MIWVDLEKCNMDEATYFNQIKEFRLIAQHDLGQNFLINPSIAKKVVELLDIRADERVIEIGAGAGSLSYYLATSGANCDLIDIDQTLIKKLEDDFSNTKSINTINQNALTTDYSSYDKIIGSLPYYITSKIIERVILTAEKAKKIVFIIQKEAADRILAIVGSKDYSPLGILLSLYGEVKREVSIPPESFSPKPHVSSIAISVKPSFKYSKEELKGVYCLANRLFAHRRKTISNNLKQFVNNSDEILSLTDIISTSRPEQVSPEEYLKLSKTMEQ